LLRPSFGTDLVLFDFEIGGDGTTSPFISDVNGIGSVTGLIGTSALTISDDWEIQTSIQTGTNFLENYIGASDEYFEGTLNPDSGTATPPGEMDADGDDDGSLSFTVYLDPGYILKDWTLSFRQDLDPGFIGPSWRMQYVYMGVTNQIGTDINGTDTPALVSSGIVPTIFDGLRGGEVTFIISGLFTSYPDGQPHVLRIDDVQLSGTLVQPNVAGEWLNAAMYFENWNAPGPDGWSGTPTFTQVTTNVPSPKPTDSFGLFFIPINTTANIQSPLLTNGIGSFSFKYINKDPADSVLAIEVSTNGSEWGAAAILTNANNSTWSTYTKRLNIYDPVYVRIRNNKVNTADKFHYIDKIEATFPSSRLLHSDYRTTSTPPRTGQPTFLQSIIIPDAYGSNLAATAWYSINGQSYVPLDIEDSGSNLWITTESIPPQPYPVYVDWYLAETFEGAPPINPTNFPGPGTNGPIRFILEPPPVQTLYTNIDVVGSTSTSLVAVLDNDWAVAHNVSGPLVNPTFTFQSGATSWGDNDQTELALPAFGVAELSGAPIQAQGSHSNHLYFMFNETNLEYSVQRAEAIDFNEFGASEESYTNFVSSEGWTITDGRVTTTNGEGFAKSYRGRTLVLNSGPSEAAVLSPAMPNGLGMMSFSYRSWETNASATTTLRIQKSATGSAPWFDALVITNIQTHKYLHERVILSDRNLNFVRILNDSNGGAELLLDDIAITDPGAGVIYSNLVYSPLSPSITNTVTVSIDITGATGAYNLEPYIWFRSGTNGIFDPTPMTNISGNTWQGTIPQLNQGIAQFYIETYFDGFGAASGLYPAGGPDDPVVYTNLDTAAVFQPFDPEGNFNSFGTTITNASGWVFHNIINLVNSGTFPVYAGTHTAWFNYIAGGYIQSPLLPGGVGTLRFWYRAQNATLNDVQLNIQTSTDGINWQSAGTLTSPANTTYVQYTNHINIYEPVYLRITKENAQPPPLPSYGIDNIEVSFPPAQIVFENVQLHPGYPSRMDTVDISANIRSAYPDNSPASNIRAELFYRRQDGTSVWSSPILMDRTGDYFRTSEPIPAFAAFDTIEYYIQASFNGYYFIESSNQSPMYYPSGGSNSPAFYEVRLFDSTYDSLRMDTDVGEPVSMNLVGDRLWQQVISIDSPTNFVNFSINGFLEYQGSNYLNGTNTWGDNDQVSTDTPLQGFAGLNQTNFMIDANFEGQLLVEFNSLTGEYIIRRAVMQDFNTWLMSDEKFTFGAVSEAGTNWSQYFEGFPLIAPILTQSLDFEGSGWTNSEYTNIFINEGWRVYDTRTFGTTNSRAEFDPSTGLGQIRPNVETLMNGVGEITFKYRARDEIAPMARYSSKVFTNLDYRLEFDLRMVSGDDLNGDPSWKGMVARYSPSETNFYEYRVQTFDESQLDIRLYRYVGGSATQVGATQINGTLMSNNGLDMRMVLIDSPTSVVATLYYNNSFVSEFYDPIGSAITNAGYIGFRCKNSYGYVDNCQVLSDTGSTMLNDGSFGGGWTLGNWKRIGNTSAQRFLGNENYPEFNVYFANITNMPFPSLWTNLASVTVSNFNYQELTVQVHTSEVGHVFIDRPSSGGSYPILFDDISFSNWESASFISNGWQISSGNIRSGALSTSSNYVELTTTKALDWTNQFVRTELLSGIGAVAFKHRTAGIGPGAFKVQRAPLGATNNWTTIATVDNSSSTWVEFSVQVNIPGNFYVRILNTTTNDESLLLDDITVVEFQQPATDTWVGENLRITPNLPSRLFQGKGRTGYLNHDATLDTAGGPFTNDIPYVRTPFLSRGAGKIGFWAANWDVSAAEGAEIEIQRSLTGDKPWTTLGHISVTNAQFEYFVTNIYLPNAGYIRLANNRSNLTDRLSLDNVVVAEPVAANMVITNLQTWPRIPLYTDTVQLECTLTRLIFQPSNITVTAYWMTGTNQWASWSEQNAMSMSLVSSQTNTQPYSYTYRTDGSIPAYPIDSVIQYFFKATFDGFFSAFTSPKDQKQYRIPSWYWPRDLNKELGTGNNDIAHYWVFSCNTGAVWINELNYDAETIPEHGSNEYVEVAGPANVNVFNWSLETLNISTQVYGKYFITNITKLPIDANGHGFWVLGDVGVTNVDAIFTNTPGPGGENLQVPGALVLKRSMGATEYQLAYGSGAEALTNIGFQYIGYESGGFFEEGYLRLNGTGTAYNSFSWSYQNTASYSPGVSNLGQYIIGTNPPPSDPPPTVTINDFWIDSSNNFWFVSTGTNTWVPICWWTHAPFSATTTWYEVTSYSQNYSNGQHTIWVDRQTNWPESIFFRIIATEQ
jgi:hypothetical protein